MKQNLTISLSEEIKSEIETMADTEGLSKSEIVRNALRDYMFINRFRTLRNKMMVKAQAQGVFNDQDVFDEIS